MRPFVLALLLIASPANAETKLSFLTFNIWSGLNYIGNYKMGEYETPDIREKRYQIFLTELRNRKPDVVALNEANFLPDYVERLAKDLNYDYVYSVGVAGFKVGRFGFPTNLKEGDALLARKDLKLREVGVIRLSSGKGIIGNFFSLHLEESNQALAAEIEVNGRKLIVVNAHTHAALPENEAWKEKVRQAKCTDRWDESLKRRRAEVRTLLDWMGKTFKPDQAVVLMGDLNAEPEAEDIGWIRESGFLDTFAVKNGTKRLGATWNSEVNLNIQKLYSPLGVYPETSKSCFERLKDDSAWTVRRIDYVMVKGVPEKSVLSSDVVLNKAADGRHASDHFGVMATVLVP